MTDPTPIVAELRFTGLGLANLAATLEAELGPQDPHAAWERVRALTAHAERLGVLARILEARDEVAELRAAIPPASTTPAGREALAALELELATLEARR